MRELRGILSGVPGKQRIDGDVRAKVIDCLDRARSSGYVDYVTLSASLLFSGNARASHEGFIKEPFYNRVRGSDIPEAADYLAGIEVRSCDYRVLVEEFKNVPGAVFLVDPPYLCTDVSTYTMSWRLSDYLDVLEILTGCQFVYFTSDKSAIIELCDWMGRSKNIGNPFAKCERVSMSARVNRQSVYEDIMLYTTV